MSHRERGLRILAGAAIIAATALGLLPQEWTLAGYVVGGITALQGFAGL